MLGMRSALGGLRAGLGMRSTLGASNFLAPRRTMHTSAPRHSTNDEAFKYLWTFTTDKGFHPSVQAGFMPRDEFGVPGHIPPDLGTIIPHTYYVPPQYYPFLKRIGDETPQLKPYMEQLINGQMTFQDYEEMFYRNAKPLKIFRDRLPMPYRTEEEIASEAEVTWEGKWYSFRQKIVAQYLTRYVYRDYFWALILSCWWCTIWMTHIRYYREDMRLYYLEAPEHKINWVIPRGDL